MGRMALSDSVAYPASGAPARQESVTDTGKSQNPQGETMPHWRWLHRLAAGRITGRGFGWTATRGWSLT